MIRVFLADDHRIIREGLGRLIEMTAGMVLAGESGSGRVVIAKAPEGKWDVLVLDLSLEDMDGTDVLRQLKPVCPRLGVVVLSMRSEVHHGPRLLKLGASAYLSKGRSSDELLDAIRAASLGRRYVTQEIADVLLTDAISGQDAPHDQLSPRENQVFGLVVRGRPPGEVAVELSLSPSTVSTHLAKIRRKLGVRSLGEMMQYAYRNGLVDPDD